MPSRQKDIEIFVREADLDRLVEWVAQTVGPIHLVDEQAETGIRIYHPAGRPGVAEFAAVITPDVGPFVSLWFNPNHTPWDRDADCARQAARNLGVEVRCDPGPEVPSPRLFLRIVGELEDLVDWDEELESER